MRRVSRFIAMSVALVLVLPLLAREASAQAQPAPTPAATPGANAAPAQPQDPSLRLTLATARIRALMAAIEFNALRLVLANLENDQPVLDALNQMLAYLTDEKNTVDGKKAAAAPADAGGKPQAVATPTGGGSP